VDGSEPSDGPHPLGEFELIARYFARPTGERQGIGDDCALIDVGGQTLAITSDMLLEGVHFLPDVDPEALGHKALAVNLSDLAAAGARPRCFLLDLALPRADARWLEAFSRGMFALAQSHGCALIGGDTTRAPQGAGVAGVLSIAITAIGEIDRARYAGRSGARPGDDIWVSGSLGEAALALAMRAARSIFPERPVRAACSAWTARRRASPWARPWRASQRRQSMSPTVCSATWGISWSALPSAPRSIGPACRAYRYSANCRRRVSTPAFWPAATTMSSSLPLPRPRGRCWKILSATAWA